MARTLVVIPSDYAGSEAVDLVCPELSTCSAPAGSPGLRSDPATTAGYFLNVSGPAKAYAKAWIKDARVRIGLKPCPVQTSGPRSETKKSPAFAGPLIQLKADN